VTTGALLNIDFEPFATTGDLSGFLQDFSLLKTNKGTRLAAGLVSSMLSCDLTQTIVR
jgi:hypothetical protein